MMSQYKKDEVIYKIAQVIGILVGLLCLAKRVCRQNNFKMDFKEQK